MKNTLFLFFLAFLLSFNVKAQPLNNSSRVVEPLFSLNFVPEKIGTEYQPVTSKYVSFNSKKTRGLLYSTGWLLQGLKFSSPIDEFSALAPFDVRAINPVSFSEYSFQVKKDYLLQEQPIPTLW